MNFEFATATTIRFGAGVSRQVGALAAGLGRRALIVTGNAERASPLSDQLHSQGIAPTLWLVQGEPTVDQVQAGVMMARQAGCDFVIGLGGGSAIDAGKAIAALLTNPGEPLDYLEVVGRGQPLTQPSAPYIAIPTTAGTGTEVTRNAVLAVPERRVKASLRSPHMLPRLALVDPQLTHSLPPDLTASTGLDALTQLIEPFVSNAANPLTDALCREGIGRAARSLRKAYENGADAAARAEMALASLLGGMALANAKLGAVHGFAGVLGGMFPMPHGVVCARLLPMVMETNVRALQSRQPDSPTLARYDELAQMLTGRASARATAGIAWVHELCAALHVPSLNQYGLTPGDFPEVVQKSQGTSSMKGNPLILTNEELTLILQQATPA
jgi:alcohol dehydrogenase class IV